MKDPIIGKFGAFSSSAWVSPRNIENYLYAVRRYVYTKQTQSLRPSLDTDRICDPLVWYISTGRASTPFLCGLFQIQPWRVGRSLMKGGSVDEAVQRIEDMVQRSADKRLKG